MDIQKLFLIQNLKIQNFYTEFLKRYPIYVRVDDGTTVQFNDADIISGEDAFYTWWQRKHENSSSFSHGTSYGS